MWTTNSSKGCQRKQLRKLPFSERCSDAFKKSLLTSEAQFVSACNLSFPISFSLHLSLSLSSRALRLVNYLVTKFACLFVCLFACSFVRSFVVLLACLILSVSVLVGLLWGVSVLALVHVFFCMFV